MVYTVTLNPAIDHTVYVEDFKYGGLNRINHCTYDAGGKGINVSKVLNTFGINNKAITIVSGKNGEIFLNKCRELGIELQSWCSEGETRINTKIVDIENSVTTELNETGPIIPKGVLDAIIRDLTFITRENDDVVLTGSLPRNASPYIYSQWSEILYKKGVKVFLDASGEALLYGLKSGVYAVKPNRAELEQFCNKKLNTTDEIIDAGKNLLSKNIRKAIVSLGKDGAYYFEDGSTLYLPPIDVQVYSTVGAGDAMLAALIYADINELTPGDTARLAVAAAAASVMCKGTETPSIVAIKNLMNRAEVSRI